MSSSDKEREKMGASNVVRLDAAGSDGAGKTASEEGEGTTSSASPSEEPTVDDEIAAAIDSGDSRRALLLCARHHGPALGRLCMAMLGSQADAEDLAQETLLDAHAGLEGWRREGSMRAWLMAIARRKCARHIEKKVRRTGKLRLVHDVDRAPQSGGTESEVLRKQRADRARAALDTVRPSEREALLLRYGSDLSFREVGQACGIEEAAARKRVSRAIATLRETLREEGQKR
jgi:RNA polymerase sigma-70 factor (ECF subfamily)